MITKKRTFGPYKYAAYSLIVARWLSTAPRPLPQYSYITLGGTELRDIEHIGWINAQLVSSVVAYEENQSRFSLALQTATVLETKGVKVKMIEGDIFEYRRASGGGHIYFVDFEGTCAGDVVCNEFREWFENEVIQPGDVLLITSYLGRNRGWEKTLEQFDGAFRILRTSDDDRKSMYEIAHPLFTIYRALIKSGRENELQLNSIGFIRYYDTSPMGLYAIAFEHGRVNLQSMVQGLPRFYMTRKKWGPVVGQ